ncbi:MAG: type II toxin-antitoxin system VapC family toxin [Microbacteriaceae bacterium]|nr:type II toxin-antitoxin system VapC family toxin [Microbacteriaceae bacterium]
MRIVDANVLLYAVNEDAPHHRSAREWLDRSLGGADTVGFSWIVMLAFIRLATKDSIFARPLGVDEATDQVGDWASAPGARVIHPGTGHLELLRQELSDIRWGGNLVNDAHLVVLARENRADIVSYDNDFSRFAGVRWATPEGLLT